VFLPVSRTKAFPQMQQLQHKLCTSWSRIPRYLYRWKRQENRLLLKQTPVGNRLPFRQLANLGARGVLHSWTENASIMCAQCCGSG